MDNVISNGISEQIQLRWTVLVTHQLLSPKRLEPCLPTTTFRLYFVQNPNIFTAVDNSCHFTAIWAVDLQLAKLIHLQFSRRHLISFAFVFIVFLFDHPFPAVTAHSTVSTFLKDTSRWTRQAQHAHIFGCDLWSWRICSTLWNIRIYKDKPSRIRILQIRTLFLFWN